MEFGRLSTTELESIDFTLPKEPASNKLILKTSPVIPPKVYVGCAKWGRPEWVGKIYPPKTKEKDFLKQYIQHYNSIELNTTHYKIYGERAIAKWAEQAKGKDFKFCPKVFQGITHKGKLNTKRFLTNEFFRGVSAFQQHLGPVLVQFSETFSPKRKQELFSYLTSLPAGPQIFLELRHAGWFEEKELTELLSFLTEHKIGSVITDAAGRRDCVHMYLTVPRAFIRFVGNSLHPTDYSRIDAWIDRLKNWLDNGLEELYFFMHMHDEATSPELTLYLVNKLNQICELELMKPIFIDQNTLPKTKPRKSRWSLNLE